MQDIAKNSKPVGKYAIKKHCSRVKINCQTIFSRHARNRVGAYPYEKETP
ncbi:conserved hypothetical protein [Neisseria gonorrhoeae 1291]|nr:conserved hypothetical protein [Neisseria gonorrhoeae 1291]EEZ42969.1 predicted protein [Neisseria gonorrhoeae 35/02]EEZ49504.1 conserved hypothetical protein [Neisseria gonorrhoeae PID18]EEZ51810.1 conserved hypothetical protein [Neisseria gonorrhoeae PID1]EEZ54161.1 conserved hypothetical protein [Neisseria gonorrhoeae PID332]EEZ56331.1 conserved hypothetical protein [Neisseria gonorrhoeae SK-92-679]EEZ58632.1 conserved hypothetical protein [Neisseria gonorrhoeae SK-93-1035]KMW64707.1 h